LLSPGFDGSPKCACGSTGSWDDGDAQRDKTLAQSSNHRLSAIIQTTGICMVVQMPSIVHISLFWLLAAVVAVSALSHAPAIAADTDCSKNLSRTIKRPLDISEKLDLIAYLKCTNLFGSYWIAPARLAQAQGSERGHGGANNRKASRLHLRRCHGSHGLERGIRCHTYYCQWRSQPWVVSVLPVRLPLPR